jgi:hypothetical protein
MEGGIYLALRLAGPGKRKREGTANGGRLLCVLRESTAYPDAVFFNCS